MSEPHPTPPALGEGQIQAVPEFNGYLATLVAAYQISVAIFAGFFAIDFVFGDKSIASSLLPILTPAFDKPMSGPFVLTVSGAVIGMIMRGLYFLQYYAAERRVFSAQYIGSYLLSPFAVSLMGVASFALVQGGLIVFSPQGGAMPDDNEAAMGTLNHMAYLSLGILSGFAWENLMARLTQAAGNVFGTEKRRVTKGKHPLDSDAGTQQGNDGARASPLPADGVENNRAIPDPNAPEAKPEDDAKA